MKGKISSTNTMYAYLPHDYRHLRTSKECALQNESYRTCVHHAFLSHVFCMLYFEVKQKFKRQQFKVLNDKVNMKNLQKTKIM